MKLHHQNKFVEYKMESRIKKSFKQPVVFKGFVQKSADTFETLNSSIAFQGFSCDDDD